MTLGEVTGVSVIQIVGDTNARVSGRSATRLCGAAPELRRIRGTTPNEPSPEPERAPDPVQRFEGRVRPPRVASTDVV